MGHQPPADLHALCPRNRILNEITMTTALTSTKKVVEGTSITITYGTYIIVGNSMKDRGERLLLGDGYVDSGFAGCQYRYPDPVFGAKHAIACNIEITGRTQQWKWGGCWVKIRIEWVGDCAPSTYSSGWACITRANL